MPDHPEPAWIRREHQALLERWRKAMNLVGPGPTDLHFDDSEAVARLLSPAGRWADLGSGAGFPGVALAAWHPGISVTLVESRAKRAAFLQRVVRRCRIPNACVFHGRAEALEAGGWDGVISRAFARPEAFLAHARRLLTPGGQAVSLLTTDPPPTPAGMRLDRCLDYSAGGRKRRLAVFSFESE